MASGHNPVVSLKPRLGRSWKRARRIEIVARLESMFIPDADIARHLGITVPALHHIKICPEYLAMRIQLQTGVISVYNKGILNTQEAQREELEDLIPMALGSIKSILMDRSHPHHAKVALDLMDRNKATAKVTKMELSVAEKPDINKQNSRARDLMALLEGNGPATIEVEKPQYNSNVGLLENGVDLSEGQGENLDNQKLEGDQVEEVDVNPIDAYLNRLDIDGPVQ
jgi:hypothetical protein